jgi:hypothetical protein
MKTKKLIKDALEIPIIVLTSLWRKTEAMHMHSATFILQFVFAWHLGVFHQDNNDAWWGRSITKQPRWEERLWFTKQNIIHLFQNTEFELQNKSCAQE